MRSTVSVRGNMHGGGRWKPAPNAGKGKTRSQMPKEEFERRMVDGVNHFLGIHGDGEIKIKPAWFDYDFRFGIGALFPDGRRIGLKMMGADRMRRRKIGRHVYDIAMRLLAWGRRNDFWAVGQRPTIPIDTKRNPRSRGRKPRVRRRAA